MAVIPDSLFHQLIRDQRRLSGLSQSALAKLAGVGKTVVFDLEHGKRSVRLDTLLKILKVLNIKISFQPPPIHASNIISDRSSKGPRR